MAFVSVRYVLLSLMIAHVLGIEIFGILKCMSSMESYLCLLNNGNFVQVNRIKSDDTAADFNPPAFKCDIQGTVENLKEASMICERLSEKNYKKLCSDHHPCEIFKLELDELHDPCINVHVQQEDLAYDLSVGTLHVISEGECPKTSQSTTAIQTSKIYKIADNTPKIIDNLSTLRNTFTAASNTTITPAAKTTTEATNIPTTAETTKTTATNTPKVDVGIIATAANTAKAATQTTETAENAPKTAATTSITAANTPTTMTVLEDQDPSDAKNSSPPSDSGLGAGLGIGLCVIVIVSVTLAALYWRNKTGQAAMTPTEDHQSMEDIPLENNPLSDIQLGPPDATVDVGDNDGDML